eukprot:4479482-Pyramimonas_sp.AAC.1
MTVGHAMTAKSARPDIMLQRPPPRGNLPRLAKVPTRARTSGVTRKLRMGLAQAVNVIAPASECECESYADEVTDAYVDIDARVTEGAVLEQHDAAWYQRQSRGSMFRIV